MNGTEGLGSIFRAIERALPAKLAAHEDTSLFEANLALNADTQTRLSREGFAVFGGQISAPSAFDPLFEAVGALGLPPLFVFAAAGTLAFAEAAVRALAPLGDYEILEDFWAFEVLPGTRGWPPHRGNGEACYPRPQPTLLNLWGAVGPAAVDRACMYAVPLDDDPNYPDCLHKIDAPLAAVRALPLDDRELLFWNANLLHWGGPASPFAGGPRRAVTATLVLRGAFPELRRYEARTLRERLDAIARQILVYGKVAPEIEAWARFTIAAGHQLTP